MREVLGQIRAIKIAVVRDAREQLPSGPLMGMGSSRGHMVAKAMRGQQSDRKQSFHDNWEEAIWVGIARGSSERVVLLEGGGPAVRCGAVWGAPLGRRAGRPP